MRNECTRCTLADLNRFRLAQHLFVNWVPQNYPVYS